MAKSKRNKVSISKKKQNLKRKSLSRKRKVIKKKKGGAIGYRLNLSDCGLGGRAVVDAYTTKCNETLVPNKCR